jgi:hypothetical protein
MQEAVFVLCRRTAPLWTGRFRQLFFCSLLDKLQEAGSSVTGVYFVLIRSCIHDPVDGGKEHARVCFVIKAARGAGSRPDEASEWG